MIKADFIARGTVHPPARSTAVRPWWWAALRQLAFGAAAAGLRRDALAGLSGKERERFVDALLAIKANLSRMQRGSSQ